MRRIVAGMSVVGAVALGATLSAWLQARPPITASEAVDVTEEALRTLGLRDVAVDPDPERGTFDPEGTDDRMEVWRTRAEVEGGPIRLWLARSDGEPVYLDDRMPESGERLLDESQFRRLEELDPDPAYDRHLRRNLLATAAGAAIMVLAVVLGTNPSIRAALEQP